MAQDLQKMTQYLEAGFKLADSIEYDDICIYKINNDITSITGFWSEHVLGMHLVFGLLNYGEHCGTMSNASSRHQSTLVLQPGEHLCRAYGYYTQYQYIEQITFVTNLNNTITFGNFPIGTFFDLFSPGYKIRGIRLSCGQYLEHIGIHFISSDYHSSGNCSTGVTIPVAPTSHSMSASPYYSYLPSGSYHSPVIVAQENFKQYSYPSCSGVMSGSGLYSSNYPQAYNFSGYSSSTSSAEYIPKATYLGKNYDISSESKSTMRVVVPDTKNFTEYPTSDYYEKVCPTAKIGSAAMYPNPPNIMFSPIDAPPDVLPTQPEPPTDVMSSQPKNLPEQTTTMISSIPATVFFKAIPPEPRMS